MKLVIGSLLSILLVSTGIEATEPSPSAAEVGWVKGVIFDSEQQLPRRDIIITSIREPAAAVFVDGPSFSMPLSDGIHRLAVYLGDGILASLGDVDVVAGQTVEVVAAVDSLGEVVSFDAEGPDRDSPVVGISPPVVSDGPAGTIEGTVANEEDGTPIAKMRIYVRGVSGSVETDERGRFRIEVPAGQWDVSAMHQQYNTVSRQDVEVIENEATRLDLKASPMGVTLADFVVSAPRIEGGTASLMEERKESLAVEDIIGAEQMSKTGDSNAAAALKRVTGITIVGGKYVYVRGLGERYSSTLFNGAMLPSPEPERRVIPLDMFPAGMLESVVVQKSYSPEMPGEFGGGVVMLRSRNYPEKLVVDLSLSGEIVTGTTFREGLVSPSGPTDWLGVDGGFRDFSDSFYRQTRDRPLDLANTLTNPDGFTSEQLDALGEMVPQQWKTWKRTIPPNWGMSASMGNTFALKKLRLGVLASGMYDSEWETLQQNMKFYTMGDGMEMKQDYDFLDTTRTIKSAGFLALGLQMSKQHSLRSTTLVTRISDNQSRIYEGYNRDLGSDLRITRQRFVERQLFTQQFLGEHTFTALNDAGVGWRYTYSKAGRLEPLRRDNRFDFLPRSEEWRLSDRPEGNDILSSTLDDQTHDMGLDLSMPISFNSENGMALHAGGTTVIRERTVDVRRFSFFTGRSNSFPAEGGPLLLPPGELFTDDYIGPFTYEGNEYVGFQLRESTKPTDNYTASQDIFAGYGRVEMTVATDWTLMGGARVEKSDQQVQTFDPFSSEGTAVLARLETTDVLPAATATWKFDDDMVLRAGYGRTLSRPEFREMSPATFYDVTGGMETIGNPDLKRATIDNVDVRWDWFWAPGEILSLGAFYKHFENPIEVSLLATEQTAKTWANATSADNIGIEFDIRKNFGFISESLEEFFFAGNASLIRSRVELEPGGVQTSKERALQGQSPFVINAQLGWDSLLYDASVILLYNVFGKRISQVGAHQLPDAYEMPFHQVNIVAKKGLGDRLGASFKIDNLFNQKVRFKQGGRPSITYSPGMAFSLGLSYSH